MTIQMPIIQYFLISSFFTFFCLFFLSIFIICDHTFNVKITRYFGMCIFLILALLITDSIRIYFMQLSYPTFACKAATLFGYIIRPICAGVVLAITMPDKKINHLLNVSIMLVNTIIILLNFLWPVTFSIDSNNIFHRETLWFVPYITSFTLLIGIIVFASIRFHTNRRKSILALSIVVSVSFAVYFEALDIAYLMVPATGAVSILFYYLSLNVDTYKRDTLTQLYNRRNFDLDCERYSHASMIIASMDLNDLKYFNDTFGHKAGDAAILTAVEGMKKYVEPIGILYRTGGDEFMAIFPKKDIKDVEDAFQRFQEFTFTTKYRVACGWAQYEPDGTLAETISNADQKMYQHKKLLKENKA